MSTNRREGKRMSRCRRCSTSAQLETLPQQKTNARRFDDVCPVDIFRFFRVEHSPETNEFVGIVATTMKKERVDRWGVPKIWDSLAGRRGHRQSNKPHFFGAEPNARARSRIEVFWVPFLTENVQRTASFVWSVTSGLRNTVRRHITQKTPQQYTVRSARGPLHFVFLDTSDGVLRTLVCQEMVPTNRQKVFSLLQLLPWSPLFQRGGYDGCTCCALRYARACCPCPTQSTLLASRSLDSRCCNTSLQRR